MNLLTAMRTRVLAGALCIAAPAVQAGHEIPYYPSFYPQEIRIEPLDPEAAGQQFLNNQDPLHAYFGAAPRFAGEPPAALRSAVSLRAFITAQVNAERVPSRDARCRLVARAAAALTSHPDVVVHRYPVTPYHADYLHHVDRASSSQPELSVADAPSPAFRAGSPGEALLLSPHARVHATDWDISISEVPLSELVGRSGIGFGLWPAPPWIKEGWFQAYHLLRPALSDPDDRSRADEIYRRLAGGGVNDEAERTSLERELTAALTRGCDTMVVGYLLRRESYSDDFSNGVENITVDSQLGFNSPVAVRTLKLKDLPWNGWMRLGINGRTTAGWNPVAGFTDAPGRLVWSIIGDNAFLPIPYNSLWVHNRTEVRPAREPAPKQSVRVPADALAAEPGTGRLAPVGGGKGAMTTVTYRVLASAFQDGSEMETADLVYPYAFAHRWGGASSASAIFDPEVSAATRLMREQFKGVRVVDVEETKLPIADLVFTYRSPIVEVYLDAVSSDEQENAVVAPPWSTVPWHLLALMDAAVEDGIAAFSATEAKKRRLPWLDLVRDPAQQDKLRALVTKFAQTGYRPAALESLVSAEAAKARWRALEQFAVASGHLLVTNGPYKLRSYTPDVYTFDVNREFTYPIGLGAFDFYAYPAKALTTRVERIGNRILVTADVEIARKEQRDRRVVRVPFKRDTLRETLPIRPVPRFVVIGDDGKVAAAGLASREPDGRFAVALPPNLPAGAYTAFTAILLDGNAVNPSIGRIDFRSN